MIDLQRIWPFALAAVVVLALGVLTLLLLLLRRSARVSRFEAAEPEPQPAPSQPKKEAKEEPAAPAGDERPKGPAPLAVRLAFGRAGRRLDKAAAGDRHRVPFFLLLGADGCRDSDLMANAGLELPFGAPADAGADLGQGRGFWFLDRGVVLDLAGDAVLAADGRGSDEGSWRSCLNLLQKLRPKRPVDGVILAVSCRELIDAQRSEAAMEELTARAGRIYRKLWQMQQRLGFRLPVYLLVTGCERLSGFESFSGLLPGKLREEMLGWSSPFGSDAVYRSGWVDEAFAALGRRMDDLQMEVFADTPAAADSLFRLPGAVRSLNAPVRGFLDQLFKQSAYHESLILRGIYFCGREEAAAEPERARRTVFLKDLLNDKVFRESGLAVPAARTVVARNRAVRLAQAVTVAVALVLGGGLSWASYSLDREADLVEEFLGDTLTHLRRMRQTGPQTIKDAELREWTIDLLGGMARMDFGYFGSAFLPSSWFSPFHDQLRQTFTRSFEEIILRAIANELDEEARSRIDAAELQEAAPVVAPSADSPVQRIEQMPEFTAFQDYVQDMEEIEKKGQLLNRLPQARDLQPLNELVSFAFNDERLPESLHASSRIYLSALRKARRYSKFDPSRFRAGASWQAEKLAASFLAGLYRRNPFAARLQRLVLSLQVVDVQKPGAGETQRFQDLVDQISSIEAALSGTELVWAFQRQFNLGPAVAASLGTMESAAIFDPESARRIRETGRADWTSFQHYLASEGSPITGSILSVREGRPEMQLSQGTLLLHTSLKTFLGQGFMAAAGAGMPVRVELPPGTRLVWDSVLLDRATAEAEAFERFREKGLGAEELRATLDAVALNRTAERVASLIARAQRFEPIPPAVSQTLAEDELKSAINTFEGSGRPVGELMTALGRIHLEEPRRDLAAAVSSEANRLLRAVDRLLDEEKAYEPRLHGFSWWEGEEPPSPRAWDASDPTEVQVYLERTRRRIADLAQVYAQPLLVWLTRTNDLPHDLRLLTGKWQGILDDIRGYEAKKPGNPVAALEDYILNQMPKVDTKGCKAAVVQSLVQTGGSQFADNLLDLSRQLASRCYSLAGQHALERYKEAAEYFNKRLAGRYPFTTRPPGPGVPEAEPEDVRAFFRKYDECQALFSSVPEGAGQERLLSDARSFLERIQKARKFFTPFLDAEKPELYPSFDVEATFRILREREVDADQIISWTLEVGSERITDRDIESRKRRWTLGEPVRLTVRWADNGPFVPVVRTPRAGVSVQDRSVVYEYRNRWSLLAALADNRAARRGLPSYNDEQPVTLALAIHTQPADGGLPREVPTEVFLRLTVLAPGTTETLDPPSFPERAPLKEEVVVENLL